MPLIWVGAALLGLLGVSKVSGDVEGLSANIAKAAPWVAVGVGAYAVAQIMKKGR